MATGLLGETKYHRDGGGATGIRVFFRRKIMDRLANVFSIAANSLDQFSLKTRPIPMLRLEGITVFSNLHRLTNTFWGQWLILGESGIRWRILALMAEIKWIKHAVCSPRHQYLGIAWRYAAAGQIDRFATATAGNR